MIRSLFRSLTRRARVESDMAAELQFHIDAFADDLVKQGVPRQEALRRARLEFGPIEAKKEECRQSLGLRFFDELRADLRYAARLLKQSPGFTAVAIVSLSLGIGANTAIFAMAKELLFTKMGVPEAGRLRAFSWVLKPGQPFPAAAWGAFGPGIAAVFSYPIYQDMRRRNTALDDLVAFKDVNQLPVTVDGEAEAVDAWLVSGNFYPVLGAKIIAGRPIAPEDDSPTAAPVCVISDAYWARRFGRSASALGRTIYLNRAPLTIVGVNAPEFKGPKSGTTAEFFLPIGLFQQVIPDPKGSPLTRNFWFVMIMGRLKPGVSEQAAQTALAASFADAFRTYLPEKKASDMPTFRLVSGGRGLDTQTRLFARPSYFLLALAGLVLLIACVNLANLLLARSASRQREMSLRLAMGASHWRVMRQVLTESLLIAILGGAAGLLLGYWGRDLIPRLFDQHAVHPQIDWAVFAFAFLITLATGLLFGLVPAWRSTRADVNSGLRETARMSLGRGRSLFGKSLVVAQVGLSLLLLVGAGLFLRTLVNLQSSALGFHTERILLFGIRAPRRIYSGPRSVELFQQLHDKIAAVPGVQSASLSAMPLLADMMSLNCFHPSGRPPTSDDADSAWTNRVGPGFFETMGLPIVSGRSFTARDNERAPRVAIVNRHLAKQFFGDANPIGQTIDACDGDPGEAKTLIEIVGVSADAKYSSLREEPPPTVYFPYLQSGEWNEMTFEIKTAASEASIIAEIREAVRSVDKDLPLLDVRTQNQQIDATLSQERVFATLSSGFGLLALILASIGIYGMMSYTVSRRTNEIGIRMALGAHASTVLGMILRESLSLTLIGVTIGLAAAAGLAKFAESMLFGLKPRDPATFAGAALLLIAVALAAGFTPARRASTVDPMQALRHE